MHIRAQNAALIDCAQACFRRLLQFEVFEVLPPNTCRNEDRGKLLCSYPGPAIYPSSRGHFLWTNAFSGSCPPPSSKYVNRLDTTPTVSSESEDSETVLYDIYESVHPRYISELLLGILRGYGQPASCGSHHKTHRGRSPFWRRAVMGKVARLAVAAGQAMRQAMAKIAVVAYPQSHLSDLPPP